MPSSAKVSKESRKIVVWGRVGFSLLAGLNLASELVVGNANEEATVGTFSWVILPPRADRRARTTGDECQLQRTSVYQESLHSLQRITLDFVCVDVLGCTNVLARTLSTPLGMSCKLDRQCPPVTHADAHGHPSRTLRQHVKSSSLRVYPRGRHRGSSPRSQRSLQSSSCV